MPLRTLGQKARDAFEVPRDLLLGRYPAFVTGGPLPRGHVPVFVFHSLEPDSFARKLQHLADNDYVDALRDPVLPVPHGHAPGARRTRWC